MCAQIDASDPGIMNERGVLLYALKQYEKAADAFVQVLQRIEEYEQEEKQRWVFVYLNLAQVYRRQGKIDLARRMLHQVEMIGGPVAVAHCVVCEG